LCVQLTAYVDNLCAPATGGVLQDETRPFPTINDALLAIDAERAASGSTAPWRVVVRPGVYNEGLITTRANVTIVGSGRSTQVTATVTASVGPCTLAHMVITQPVGGTNAVNVDATLVVHHVAWYFAPTTLAPTTGFVLGTGATTTEPVLHIFDSYVQIVVPAGATANAGFVTMANANGTSGIEFVARHTRCVLSGTQPYIVSRTANVATTIVRLQDCLFDITATAQPPTETFLYGAFTLGVPVVIDWIITDCVHNVNNVVPGAAYATPIYGFEFILANPVSGLTGCIAQGCTFHFIGFTNTTAIYAGQRSIFATSVLQLLNNSWVGTTTLTGNTTDNVPTTFVPRWPTGVPPFVLQGTSSSGSLVGSGGLQTGVTTLASPGFTATLYTVVDGDCIIAWTPVADSTLVLPANAVFAGKWIALFNLGTNNITITGNGGAFSVIIAGGGRAFVVTADGTNWFSVV